MPSVPPLRRGEKPCSSAVSYAAMEDSPPYGTVRPIRSSAAALGWVLTTLRSIADALETARPKEAADAMIQLTPTIQELERRAALVLARRATSR